MLGFGREPRLAQALLGPAPPPPSCPAALLLHDDLSLFDPGGRALTPPSLPPPPFALAVPTSERACACLEVQAESSASGEPSLPAPPTRHPSAQPSVV